MDYLPLFADLSGRPVLVVGGGDIAARKIELLRRARARVQIAARELCPELQALLETQQLEWLATAFDPAQLDGVFLVIAATDDNALNAAVFEAANARQKLVNVVDDYVERMSATATNGSSASSASSCSRGISFTSSNPPVRGSLRPAAITAPASK